MSGGGNKGGSGGLFGGSGSPGTLFEGGGTGAPWNWGTSPFDLSSIDTAVDTSTSNIQNRYNQLGLGGSTMEGQDVTGAQDAGQAMIGQQQTANVGQPALNPAEQPQLNNLVGFTPSSSGSSSLSSLAQAAGAAAGAGSGISTLLSSLPLLAAGA
jgi:hypothetical protein